MLLEQALDDLDRAVDAGAERARSSEKDAAAHAELPRNHASTWLRSSPNDRNLLESRMQIMRPPARAPSTQ
jgi:hypothetical protein